MAAWLWIALAVAVTGLAWKKLAWLRAPVPLPMPLPPAPATWSGVVLRMLREGLFFETLFRANRWTWLFGWIFHASLLLVLVRHAWLFVDPAPAWTGPLLAAGAGLSAVLAASLAGLLARRLFVARVRYVSVPSDYLMLLLILVIAGTGALARPRRPALARPGPRVRPRSRAPRVAAPPPRPGALAAPRRGRAPRRAPPLQQAPPRARRLPDPHPPTAASRSRAAREVSGRRPGAPGSMSTLHTVNRSPFEHGALEGCLARVRPGSAVLLIEDGVLVALDGSRFASRLGALAGRRGRALRPRPGPRRPRGRARPSRSLRRGGRLCRVRRPRLPLRENGRVDLARNTHRASSRGRRAGGHGGRSGTGSAGRRPRIEPSSPAASAPPQGP